MKNYYGFSILEVTIASALLGGIALVGLKVIEGFNTTNNKIKTYSESLTMQQEFQSSLSPISACSKNFCGIINYVNPDEGLNCQSSITIPNSQNNNNLTLNVQDLGPLNINNTAYQVGQNFSDGTILDYKLILSRAKDSKKAFGDLEIKVEFTQKGNSIQKTINIPLSFDINSSNNRLGSCSSTGATAAALCDIFGGNLNSDNKCDSVILTGDNTNSGTINGGDLIDNSFENSQLSEGVLKNAFTHDNVSIQGGTFKEITSTGENKIEESTLGQDTGNPLTWEQSSNHTIQAKSNFDLLLDSNAQIKGGNHTNGIFKTNQDNPEVIIKLGGSKTIAETNSNGESVTFDKFQFVSNTNQTKKLKYQCKNILIDPGTNAVPGTRILQMATNKTGWSGEIGRNDTKTKTAYCGSDPTQYVEEHPSQYITPWTAVGGRCETIDYDNDCKKIRIHAQELVYEGGLAVGFKCKIENQNDIGGSGKCKIRSYVDCMKEVGDGVNYPSNTPNDYKTVCFLGIE